MPPESFIRIFIRLGAGFRRDWSWLSCRFFLWLWFLSGFFRWFLYRFLCLGFSTSTGLTGLTGFGSGGGGRLGGSFLTFLQLSQQVLAQVAAWVVALLHAVAALLATHHLRTYVLFRCGKPKRRNHAISIKTKLKSLAHQNWIPQPRARKLNVWRSHK